MEITTQIWTVIETVNGEAEVVASFNDKIGADACRATLVREYAREAVLCGVAPEDGWVRLPPNRAHRMARGGRPVHAKRQGA